jgi:3-hydroxybutyryl-CoA dehydrogenase
MNIGIVGAGAMGTGIAQVMATAGHDVVVYDINDHMVNTSRDSIDKVLKMLSGKGKIDDATSKAIFSRLYFSTNLSSMKDSDLIIEAIVENIEVKKNVFCELEKLVSEKCILASNTSSLSITSIAASCQIPNRFIGIHFFNPAPIMKLVEIIPAIQTDQSVVDESVKII